MAASPIRNEQQVVVAHTNYKARLPFELDLTKGNRIVVTPDFYTRYIAPALLSSTEYINVLFR